MTMPFSITQIITPSRASPLPTTRCAIVIVVIVLVLIYVLVIISIVLIVLFIAVAAMHNWPARRDAAAHVHVFVACRRRGSGRAATTSTRLCALGGGGAACVQPLRIWSRP